MPDAKTDVSAIAELAQPVDDRPKRQSTREALVDAFPQYVVMNVPADGETLGRSWFASYNVDDPRVSVKHVTFTRNADGARMIADAGSRNGTYLNGHKLRPGDPAPLADGAVLLVGGQVLVYREELLGKPAPDTHARLTAPYGLRRVTEQLLGWNTERPFHVLVEGEAGIEWEAIAAEMAWNFGRPREKILRVRAGALSESHFGSELFGRGQGAYPGATTDEPGWILEAQGGTLFIDDIDEMPPAVQAGLAGVLQTRTVTAVGSTEARPFDTVVVGGTTRWLAGEVEQGRFREDLYYSLAEELIELPPLRERKEDIVAHVRGIVQKRGLAIDVKKMDPDAIERLMVHPWRRNLAELEEVLGEIAALSAGSGALTRRAVDMVIGSVGAAGTVRVPTNEEVLAVYAGCGEHEGRAARVLEMSREGVRRRVRAERARREG